MSELRTVAKTNVVDIKKINFLTDATRMLTSHDWCLTKLTKKWLEIAGWRTGTWNWLHQCFSTSEVPSRNTEVPPIVDWLPCLIQYIFKCLGIANVYYCSSLFSTLKSLKNWVIHGMDKLNMGWLSNFFAHDVLFEWKCNNTF